MNTTTMHKQALCIINPVAGKRKSGREVCAMIGAFYASEYDVKVHLTRQSGDGTRLVLEHAAGKDLIICSGGDGTLNEVIAGVMQLGLDTPVYYVPAGTSNDFARTLRLSHNAGDFGQTTGEGLPVWHDAGMFNGGSSFAYVAAFGAFTRAAHKTPQSLKNKLGYTAYILGGIKSLDTLRAYKGTVRTEKEAYSGKFLLGFVSNATSVGGVIKLGQDDVTLDDGKFELMLIRFPDNPAQLLGTLADLNRGRFDGKHIILTHAAQIEFDFEREVDWTLDGESIGTFAGGHVGVAHNAFRLLINPTEDVARLYSQLEQIPATVPALALSAG